MVEAPTSSSSYCELGERLLCVGGQHGTAISSLDEECGWSIRNVNDQWEVVDEAEVHCIS